MAGTRTVRLAAFREDNPSTCNTFSVGQEKHADRVRTVLIARPWNWASVPERPLVLPRLEERAMPIRQYLNGERFDFETNARLGRRLGNGSLGPSV